MTEKYEKYKSVCRSIGVVRPPMATQLGLMGPPMVAPSLPCDARVGCYFRYGPERSHSWHVPSKKYGFGRRRAYRVWVYLDMKQTIAMWNATIGKTFAKFSEFAYQMNPISLTFEILPRIKRISISSGNGMTRAWSDPNQFPHGISTAIS